MKKFVCQVCGYVHEGAIFTSWRERGCLLCVQAVLCIISRLCWLPARRQEH